MRILITVVAVILRFRLYHTNLSQQALKIHKIKEAGDQNRKWLCVCVSVCVCVCVSVCVCVCVCVWWGSRGRGG